LLGKLAAKRPDLPDFKTYFEEALPAPPPHAHYGARVTVPWGMAANGPDPTVTLPGVPPGWGGCGDCVVGGGFDHFTLSNNYNFGSHGPQDAAWSSNTDVEVYCKLAGCTPEQLFTNPDQYDTGLEISTAFTTWTKTAFNGIKLGAYAPVDYTNLDDVKNAIYLCGSANVGVQLPQSAEDQFPHTWTYVPGSQILGGHDVLLTGYDSPTKMFWAVTWGALIGVTEEFLSNYLDEAYACVSDQAIKAGKGPTSLKIAALEADIKQL
jgi:hypothetical protein